MADLTLALTGWVSRSKTLQRLPIRSTSTLRLRVFIAAIVFIATAGPIAALEPVRVTGGIFAFVGEKKQRSRDNLANNATFGLIVNGSGAVLVDSGGSWKGAEVLHAAIRGVTRQPVRYVINTGGQDQRWFGNAYWRKQGALVIASEGAVADQKQRGSAQLAALVELLGEQLEGTQPTYADVTFKDAHKLRLGDATIEIHDAGTARTPGSSYVWVPARSTVFTGDIVYVERMLAVSDFSNSKLWLDAFDAVAGLNPEFIVPGHGGPTTLSRAKAETYDYLAGLRERIGAHIRNGGDMISAGEVDQSAFRHLELFDSLARRNARAVFAEMEFE